MNETNTNNWVDISLAPEGVILETKIDDNYGIRNVQNLIRIGKFWFLTDKSMYIYYVPTHWRYPKRGGV